MGQRILISEEEKKTILSLYEIKNTPPDESVSVAFKNPYRYPELEDARRPYSVQLKDGDRFYVITDFLEKFLEGKYSPFRILYDSIVGKTIRDTSRDSIYKIGASTYSNGVDFTQLYPTDIKYYNVQFYYYIGSYHILVGYYPKTNSTNIYQIKSIHDTKPSNLQVEYPSIFSALSPIADKLKTTYTEYFSDLSQLPDEAFEIRKIERVKTDF